MMKYVFMGDQSMHTLQWGHVTSKKCFVAQNQKTLLFDLDDAGYWLIYMLDMMTKY